MSTVMVKLAIRTANKSQYANQILNVTSRVVSEHLPAYPITAYKRN
jgi:hypothetical protein